MNIEFEHPEMVSIGSKPDLLVAEIEQESFFSRIDEPPSIKQGT